MKNDLIDFLDNHKNKILYILIMIFLSILYLNLNSVIKFFMSDSTHFNKIDFSEIHNNCDVSYYVDRSESFSDIFGSIYFEGWAFCETSENNENKLINFILKKGSDSYIAKGIPSNRLGLSEYFSDKKINDFAQFETTINSFSVPSGLYDLFIHVKENDNTEGYIFVDQYLKNHDGLNKFEPGKVDNFDNVLKNQNLLFSIDEVNTDYNIVSGWGALADTNISINQIYLQISQNNKVIATYETSKEIRRDVVEFYNNDNYLLSGFSVTIDPDIDLSVSTLNLILFDDKNNDLYISNNYVLET